MNLGYQRRVQLPNFNTIEFPKEGYRDLISTNELTKEGYSNLISTNLLTKELIVNKLYSIQTLTG